MKEASWFRNIALAIFLVVCPFIVNFGWVILFDSWEYFKNLWNLYFVFFYFFIFYGIFRFFGDIAKRLDLLLFLYSGVLSVINFYLSSVQGYDLQIFVGIFYPFLAFFLYLLLRYRRYYALFVASLGAIIFVFLSNGEFYSGNSGNSVIKKRECFYFEGGMADIEHFAKSENIDYTPDYKGRCITFDSLTEDQVMQVEMFLKELYINQINNKAE